MMMWGTGSPPNLEIPLIPEIAGMAGTGWVDQNSTSKRHTGRHNSAPFRGCGEHEPLLQRNERSRAGLSNLIEGDSRSRDVPYVLDAAVPDSVAFLAEMVFRASINTPYTCYRPQLRPRVDCRPSTLGTDNSQVARIDRPGTNSELRSVAGGIRRSAHNRYLNKILAIIPLSS
jgi:hypothetical protein